MNDDAGVSRETPAKRLTPKQRAELTKKWKYPSHTWGTALLDLEQCGFIKEGSLQGMDDGVFACTATQGFAAIARELAYLLPGQLAPAKNNKSITWINGKKDGGGPAGILFDWEAYKDISQARLDINGMIPTERIPWSVGACARLLIDHIGIKQPYEKHAELLLLDGERKIEYGYHCCYPGRYIGSTARHVRTGEVPVMRDLFDMPSPRRWKPNELYVAEVTLYDVSSYYFSILQRMDSLLWTIYPNKARKQVMPSDAIAAWRDVLDLVAPSKLLRNSLAGCMAGSQKSSIAFTRDLDTGGVKTIQRPRFLGPLRACGLLVVRAGVELCQSEALINNAIYATIDSVGLTRGDKPSVWPSFGFHVERKAAGNAELCHRGSYKVGMKQTLNYKNQHREYKTVERGELPRVLYYKSFL